jgi:DNA-binding GntR family transcriptional regulator
MPRRTLRSVDAVEGPVPLRHKVYDALEEMIIYRSLEPGEHLVEADVAQRLGVSRVPVREALQMLARDGWVDLRPHQGAFVHRPTAQEVQEVFSVRAILEVESARLAATAATDEAVRSLTRLLEAGKAALADESEKELVLLNSEFHSEITRTGGNHVLAELIARLDKRIRWYFAPVVRVRGTRSWVEHAAIVKRISAHDPRGAGAAMRTHAEATRDAYFAATEGAEAESIQLEG